MWPQAAKEPHNEVLTMNIPFTNYLCMTAAVCLFDLVTFVSLSLVGIANRLSQPYGTKAVWVNLPESQS